MAESVNGGGNPSQSPKEMSMEMRLLLAFLLMGAVMFVFQYLSPQAPPPKKQTPTTSAQTTPAAETPAATPAPVTPEPAAKAATPNPAATPQVVQPPLVIETDLYKVTLSNQGGNIRSWQLKKAKGNDGKPLDLVNPKSGMDFPYSLHFPGTKPTPNVNWTWYQQTVDPDHLGVTYVYSDGHISVRKVIRFQQNSYLSMVSTEATQDGKPLPAMIEWRGGFGDLTVAAASTNQRSLYFDVPNNKLVEEPAKAAAKGPITASGQFSFGGLADNYFALVFLTEGNAAMQQVTFADNVPTPFTQTPEYFSGVALSDGEANRFEVFVGPKDLEQLRSINPKLEQVVDFGWLSVIAKPLFLLVNWVNSSFVHNFGWSIVLITIVINLALFPLRLGNMKSMRKMQALKPQIDAINAKYKNVSLRDPKKADQNQEVMDLYKKYGVNPMGGCLPMVIQLPFFFAFYKVFTVSEVMRGASWLWVHDLSQPETLAIHILPIIMVASQFFMQSMTPQAAGVDPNQQKMMKFMPLMFGFFFYNLPSGLVLYYLTSNLVGMGLQWFFNKTAMADDAALSVAPPKKNGRK
ncbi:MAG TPA: membrane protein insertase YidC [Candidatus Acidoferrum sp.]|nr:membrane protein insertase YidC [Candidatus Acidoferrum sp.]